MSNDDVIQRRSELGDDVTLHRDDVIVVSLQVVLVGESIDELFAERRNLFLLLVFLLLLGAHHVAARQR